MSEKSKCVHRFLHFAPARIYENISLSLELDARFTSQLLEAAAAEVNIFS